MSETLTDLAIRKLHPKGGERIEVWDSRAPGFGVRVSPTGNKSFIVVYRHKGRPRRMTLGKYPIMALQEARELATEAIRNAKREIDPQHQKVVERTGVRFDQTVDLYVRTYCTQHNREHRRETERLLKSRFVSRWGARDVREITKVDRRTWYPLPSDPDPIIRSINDKGYYIWRDACWAQRTTTLAELHDRPIPSRTNTREYGRPHPQLASVSSSGAISGILVDRIQTTRVCNHVTVPASLLLGLGRLVAPTSTACSGADLTE